MCTGTMPSVCTTTCGDGVVAGTEACDDGDTMGGDGCSATCTVESGFMCTGTMPSVCDEVCGDAMVVGSETCDGAVGITDCATDCPATTMGTVSCSPTTCTIDCSMCM